MYPERGMDQRRRVPRFRIDKSSLLTSGKGIPEKPSERRRGADPPRNDSGRVGTFPPSEYNSKCVSFGNGFSTAAIFFIREFGMPRMSILRTRQCCSSALMMLSIPLGRFPLAIKSMTIGNAGQMSSIFSGRFGVQSSRRCRRRGESNTTDRHRRHTWTRVCHTSSSAPGRST